MIKTMPAKSKLKIEAEGIIQELRLLDLLSQHGEVRVVGSVALDLIVKLDIDIHVLIAEETGLLNAVDPTYHQLLDFQQVREVRITDYRNQNAVKIGIDVYPGASGDWSIDIWITDKVEETAFEYVENLKRAIRPEHRDAILCIKGYYDRRGQLRDGISVLIYEAVVDNDVRTVEEFKQFLSRQGKSIKPVD